MKTLFWIGLVCVVVGLLSFLVIVPHTPSETFQSGGIGINSSQTDHRPMPAMVGSILILGGLSIMIGGCRTKVK